MTALYLLVWGFVAVFGVTAVYGLVWAVRRGQLRNPGHAALSIFDDDEPPGTMTDRFPGPGGAAGEEIE